MPRSFDGGTHLLRIGRLDEHLRSGALFPRWIPELLLGNGYPVFNYYAPSTYYLVELFHLIGLDLYHAFILSFCVLVLAGALGVYFLALDTYNRPAIGRWAALLAAAAYLYSPYLMTNVYIRGAIAEVGALALLPWIFWSVRRLFYAEHPGRYVLAVALSLGGLALTHNITLLFVPPILIGYMIIHWQRCGRDWPRFWWAMTSLLLAMGISAFFWLPLILERGFLSERAYLIAKNAWLPMSMWTWENAFDLGLFYAHTFARPIRIGLVSVVMGLAGFFLAGRKDAEWIYLLVVALVAAIFGGQWALPIWVSNDILPIAQFPWRLLSIITLFLSVLTGGMVLKLPQGHPRQWTSVAASLALIMFIVITGQPRLDWIDLFSAKSLDVSTAVAVQLEIDRGIETGAQGISSLHEYRPKWAGESLTLEAQPASTESELAITLQSGNAFDLSMTTIGAIETPLRFATFYFPGWEVLLDNEVPLQTYPSTSLGLLTVDLPAGEHSVTVHWVGTTTQKVAGMLSLVALVVLAWVVWRRQWMRGLIVVPLFFIAFGLAAAFISPAVEPIRPPVEPLQTASLTLLGYRLQQQSSDTLTIYPYWQVTDAAPPDLQIHWQVEDQEDQVLAELRSLPYYNAVRAGNWPIGTVVDDAIRIPLPAGMNAGSYQITLQLEDSTGVVLSGQATLGEFSLASTIPASAPPTNLMEANVAEATMGDAAILHGYDVDVRHGTARSTQNDLLALEAGDYLEYTLTWSGYDPVDRNYHAFVHLTDQTGQPIAQEDHLPGPLFQPPRLWNQVNRRPDVYLLRIPDDTPGGLYQPLVGMYDYDTLDRLPVSVPGEEMPRDDARLAAVKIVQPQPPTPAKKVTADFGDLTTLIGYDLVLPETDLHPGERFDLTLHFRANTTTPVDYTRFVQVYDPALGMAAQYDSLPQNGGNPTWSWLEDEIVVDHVQLQIADDAQPGVYPIYVGFYDRAENGARLPVTDGNGTLIPESWYPVAEITVAP